MTPQEDADLRRWEADLRAKHARRAAERATNPHFEQDEADYTQWAMRVGLLPRDYDRPAREAY